MRWRRWGWTFAQIAVALAAYYRARAWPLAKVRDFCIARERRRRSPWDERDPEVACFCEDRFGRHTNRAIHRAVGREYGRRRAPSPTTIGTYWRVQRGFGPARPPSPRPARRAGQKAILAALARRDPRFADRDQASLIDHLPRRLAETWSDVAAACHVVFGRRAWPRALIVEYAAAVAELPNGQLHRIAEVSVLRFIEENHEKMPFAQLVAEGRFLFGRFPTLASVAAASLRLRAGRPKGRPRPHRPKGRPRPRRRDQWMRDAEVTAFVDCGLAVLGVRPVHRRARAAFGPSRAPSLGEVIARRRQLYDIEGRYRPRWPARKKRALRAAGG